MGNRKNYEGWNRGDGGDNPPEWVPPREGALRTADWAGQPFSYAAVWGVRQQDTHTSVKGFSPVCTAAAAADPVRQGKECGSGWGAQEHHGGNPRWECGTCRETCGWTYL